MNFLLLKMINRTFCFTHHRHTSRVRFTVNGEALKFVVERIIRWIISLNLKLNSKFLNFGLFLKD